MDTDPWADAPAPAAPVKSAPTTPKKSKAKRKKSKTKVADAPAPEPVAEVQPAGPDVDEGAPASPSAESAPLSPVAEPAAGPEPAADDDGDIGTALPSVASPVKTLESELPASETKVSPAQSHFHSPETSVKELEEVDPYASSVGVLGGALAATSLDKDLDDDDVFTTPPVAAKTAPPSPAQSAALGDDGFDDDGFDTPAQTAAVASTSLDNGFGDDDRFEDDGGFDDFDDFDAPTATFDDDGFGDFGDFEEGEAALEPIEAPAPAPPAPVLPVVDWTALSLRPVPPRGELLSRIADVLKPLVPSGESFTDEEPRAVGGLAQVLATESTRDTYAQLTTAPMLKPLDWTRSRVRRDHLIAMGVPVNLDEVDSHRLSTLPPLQITTSFPRPKSTDPGTGTGPMGSRVGSVGTSRAGTAGTSLDVSRGPGAGVAAAVGGAQNEPNHGLGQRPALDLARAQELCALEEDQLSLMPLARLESLLEDLARNTADASTLLSWLLQLKDAQSQDQATYNGMISELIANAAKVKGGSTGGGLFRRASQKQPTSRPASVSVTPRRVGSPGTF